MTEFRTNVSGFNRPNSTGWKEQRVLLPNVTSTRASASLQSRMIITFSPSIKDTCSLKIEIANGPSWRGPSWRGPVIGQGLHRMCYQNWSVEGGWSDVRLPISSKVFAILSRFSMILPTTGCWENKISMVRWHKRALYTRKCRGKKKDLDREVIHMNETVQRPRTLSYKDISGRLEDLQTGLDSVVLRCRCGQQKSEGGIQIK